MARRPLAAGRAAGRQQAIQAGGDWLIHIHSYAWSEDSQTSVAKPPDFIRSTLASRSNLPEPALLCFLSQISRRFWPPDCPCYNTQPPWLSWSHGSPSLFFTSHENIFTQSKWEAVGPWASPYSRLGSSMLFPASNPVCTWRTGKQLFSRIYVSLGTSQHYLQHPGHGHKLSVYRQIG